MQATHTPFSLSHPFTRTHTLSHAHTLSHTQFAVKCSPKGMKRTFQMFVCFMSLKSLAHRKPAKVAALQL